MILVTQNGNIFALLPVARLIKRISLTALITNLVLITSEITWFWICPNVYSVLLTMPSLMKLIISLLMKHVHP